MTGQTFPIIFEKIYLFKTLPKIFWWLFGKWGIHWYNVKENLKTFNCVLYAT